MKFSTLQYLLPFAFLFLLVDDNPTKDKIVKGIENWKNTYPQEKVFLQLDRQKYIAGESIWFKATCTYDGQATFLSRIIYVTLTNSAGKVVEKKMFKLDKNASAYSSFDLSKQLKSDNYIVSAYTLWMLNFPEYLPRQTVYVYGTDYSKRQQALNNQQQNIFVDFFPEGGDLIDGLQQRCAFKVANQDGYPLSITTDVVDENGSKITTISSTHNGMGVFDIEPKFKKSYSIRLTNKKNKTFTFKLPVVKQEGVSLAVTNTSATKLFAVLNRSEFNKAKYNNLYLTAHINGKLVYMANANFDEDKTAFPIPKKNLPAGIMQITVFDTSGNPLAERIAFIENYKIKQPEIAINKKNLSQKEWNEFSFEIDSVDNPNVSVLVKSNIENSNTQSVNNVASSLLLTSDIKGYVHQPAYYFSSKNAEVLQNLDLVMLTNGWRRFEWKDIMDNKQLNLKYPIESNIAIKGKVLKLDKQEAIKEGKVNMIIKGEDSTKTIVQANLTDKGEFIVDSLNIRGGATVYYEGTNAKKEKMIVDVKFYHNHIDTLATQSTGNLQNIDTTDLAYRGNEFDTYLYNRLASIDTLTFGGQGYLGNVTVTSKKRSREDSLTAEYVKPIFEISDQTLDLTEAATKYANIWVYLRQFVPGLNVDPFAFGGVTQVSFSRFDAMDAISADGSGTVKFFVNEIEVDAASIDIMNIDDIALVKVYKGALATPLGSSVGAIAIYTKKGRSFKAAYEKTFEKKEILGFSSLREYFAPKYNSPATSTTIDKRITLFWKPVATSTTKNYFNYGFSNNDFNKGYTIIVQGIDKNGQLIYSEKKVE
ncbi:MAG: hypothetical protein ACOVMI_11010 [Chitinophagaceae bacterium]